MDDLMRAVTSPAWWLSTVIAALVVNLLTPHISRASGAFLTKIWSRWNERSKASSRAFQMLVDKLSEDSAELLVSMAHELRLRHDMYMSGLGALVMINALQIKTGIFGGPGGKLTLVLCSIFFLGIAGGKLASWMKLSTAIDSARRIRELGLHIERT